MTHAAVLGNAGANTAIAAVFGQKGLYLGLSFGDPSAPTPSAGEVTGPGYQRQGVTFTLGSRAASNAAALVFDDLNAVTVNYLVVWDAPAGGNVIAWLDITDDPVAVVQGGGVTVPVNTLAWAA